MVAIIITLLFSIKIFIFFIFSIKTSFVTCPLAESLQTILHIHGFAVLGNSGRNRRNTDCSVQLYE